MTDKPPCTLCDTGVTAPHGCELQTVAQELRPAPVQYSEPTRPQTPLAAIGWQSIASVLTVVGGFSLWRRQRGDRRS